MEGTRHSSERMLKRMNVMHGVAIVVLGALAFMIHITLKRHISDARYDARLINHAGLERMRIQRAALLATRLLTDPRQGPILRPELAKLSSLIKTTWEHLPPLHKPLSTKPGHTTARMEMLLSHLTTLSSPGITGRRRAALINQVVQAADGPLAASLDRRVYAYQQIAEQDNERLLTLARDQFILVVSALGALTLFIFMPLARLTRTEVRRLTDAAAYNKTLFESAPDAIIVIDENGVIEEFNPAAETLFSRTAKETYGQPVDILMPEPDRSRHAGYLERYHTTGEPHVIGRLREVTAIRQDGTLVPAELSVGAIDGQRRRYVGVLRDLSMRKAAEQALEVVHRRYQDLITNIDVGVCRVEAGPSPRFVETNPALLALFEAQNREALLSHPVDTLFVHEEDRAIFGQSADPRRFPKDHEFLLTSCTGRQFWATINAVQKVESGQVYYDGVIDDVTDRRQAQQTVAALNQNLERRLIDLDVANKELEAFSYSVSHDLRAPLRSIDGFSQALLEDYADKVDAMGRDYLARIRAASQKMAQLIDDLLLLSRVSRARLVRNPVNISAIAADVAASLQAAEPGRAVEWRISDDLIVRGDAVLLRQVMTNLLANAWKFTSRQAHALIEVGEAAQEGARRLFVRDNGAGFDMTYVDRLFGVFQRLHTTQEFNGTGIGLAIVSRIVRRHGGQVYAEGAVDAGACFSFTLKEEEEFDASRS